MKLSKQGFETYLSRIRYKYVINMKGVHAMPSLVYMYALSG